MKKKKALSILKDVVRTKEQLDIDLHGPHMVSEDNVYQIRFNEEVCKALKKAIKVMKKEV